MDSSYGSHLTNLNDDHFTIMKVIALSQFIPMFWLENNLYYTDIITSLKRQGARDLANEPVTGAGLLFSFDNNNSSTTVRIVRQRITFAGIIVSRLIYCLKITILHAHLPTDL